MQRYTLLFIWQMVFVIFFFFCAVGGCITNALIRCRRIANAPELALQMRLNRQPERKLEPPAKPLEDLNCQPTCSPEKTL